MPALTPDPVAATPDPAAAPALVVRRATPADADAIREVLRATYLDTGFVPADSDYAATVLDSEVRIAGDTVLVAERAGEVIGSITIMSPDSPRVDFAEGDEVELRLLGVAPTVQRSGAGRALTLASIEHARSIGAGAVVLHSSEMMTAAHRLYEALGAERVAARDRVLDHGELLLTYRFGLTG